MGKTVAGIGVGGSTITLCKPHKVCISLWLMGWNDVRTRVDKSPFSIGRSRGLMEVLLRLCSGIILC